jgi:RHS repeat-associated protein
MSGKVIRVRVRDRKRSSHYLNTARLITNQAAQAVWRWDQAEPFGGNPPDENPSGLGSFAFNLRFPGQYADKETNLHYNMMRDYDPAIGRYIQSDPLGIVTTQLPTPTTKLNHIYLYVAANPLSVFDRYGMQTDTLDPGTRSLARHWIPRCKFRGEPTRSETTNAAGAGVEGHVDERSKGGLLTRRECRGRRRPSARARPAVREVDACGEEAGRSERPRGRSSQTLIGSIVVRNWDTVRAILLKLEAAETAHTTLTPRSHSAHPAHTTVNTETQSRRGVAGAL